MNLLLLIISTLIVSEKANSLYDDIFQNEWHAYKLRHGKIYANSHEEELRKNIFLEKWRYVAKHNLNYEKGLIGYKLEMNKFADMLNHEVARLNGYNKTRSHHGHYPYDSRIVNHNKFVSSTFFTSANAELPDSIDWRDKGAVTPVKDQGNCGACWAFSATGSLEGQNFRKNGVLVSLSEQNLVDCSENFGNHGCIGGKMDYAFYYISTNKGIDTEKSYPFEGITRTCRYKPKNNGGYNTDYTDIASGDEEQLKIAVATVGPVSVAIDASYVSFHLYQGGVYSNPKCLAAEANHAVLVVGYGTTKDGEDYWIVKNSWNVNWGEKGYFRIARNENNMCGIASYASYPIVS